MPHASPLSAGRPLLTAEWRHLAMLNFDIEPAVLQPFVPRGTELDTWQGRTLMSLVGFRFLKTRIWGLPIPRHRNFEELNLRFYVRRQAPDGWRRGVVFIKELVPRRADRLGRPDAVQRKLSGRADAASDRVRQGFWRC